MRLEQVLQCELKLTLSLCVVDQTEGGTDAGVRSHQDGVVQSVDSFGTELQTLVLNDLEALDDAEVNSLKAGTAEAANLAVAERPETRLRYRARTEPDVAGIVGIGGLFVRRFDRAAAAVG